MDVENKMEEVVDEADSVDKEQVNFTIISEDKGRQDKPFGSSI